MQQCEAFQPLFFIFVGNDYVGFSSSRGQLVYLPTRYPQSVLATAIKFATIPSTLLFGSGDEDCRWREKCVPLLGHPFTSSYLARISSYAHSLSRYVLCVPETFVNTTAIFIDLVFV